MWNPFKKQHLVPIDDCINMVLDAIKRSSGQSYSLFEWLEVVHGVKRKWSWRDNKNYLVFDSEQDYVVFLLKL
jgi:hypothetical protein